MTSVVTAVTADGAAYGVPCVRPGRSEAVWTHGERYVSPAQHPHCRRDVCARVRTDGVTDVNDPGGYTGEVSSFTWRAACPSYARWPAASQSNSRDPYATRPCL